MVSFCDSSRASPGVRTLLSASKVLIELSAHLLALTAILLGIKLIELLVKALWGEDYLFFERVNLKYVFDIFDLAIVVFFLISGVYLVGAAYVRKP